MFDFLPATLNYPGGRPFGCGQLSQPVVITGRTTRRLYADSNSSNNTGRGEANEAWAGFVQRMTLLVSFGKDSVVLLSHH